MFIIQSWFKKQKRLQYLTKSRSRNKSAKQKGNMARIC